MTDDNNIIFQHPVALLSSIYCHVLSDYRRILDCQLDLLGLNTFTVYYTSQLNTAAATLLASPVITY
jgi:hypothetical protein